MYVCIYISFQSKCVPSQQWCFSESPPPLAEWGLQDAATCTVARPSRQLDRCKLPHQDATLAQCPAEPYTGRPSPLAAAWSTCSYNQYGGSSFIKHITAELFRYCAMRRHVEGECLPTFRTVTLQSEHLAPRTLTDSDTHSGRLEASATPDIIFTITLKGRTDLARDGYCETWILEWLTVTRSDIPQQQKLSARVFIHKYLAFRMWLQRKCLTGLH